jgi:hypothetical protein
MVPTDIQDNLFPDDLEEIEDRFETLADAQRQLGF